MVRKLRLPDPEHQTAAPNSRVLGFGDGKVSVFRNGGRPNDLLGGDTFRGLIGGARTFEIIDGGPLNFPKDRSLTAEESDAQARDLIANWDRGASEQWTSIIEDALPEMHRIARVQGYPRARETALLASQLNHVEARRLEILIGMLKAEKITLQEVSRIGGQRALESVSEGVQRLLSDRLVGVPLPDPVTAGNVETCVQAFAHVCTVLSEENRGKALEWLAQIESVGEYSTMVPGVAKFRGRCKELVERLDRRDPNEEGHTADWVVFAFTWLRSSFARVEVGHRLASALCLTDYPDEEHLPMPWPAWSLVVPDGLLDPIARVWVGEKCVVPIGRDGRRVFGLEPPLAAMLKNLVFGVAYSLSDPEKYRKPSAGSSRTKGNQRSGPPDLAQARYLLAPPVTVEVDFRAHVREVLSGARREGPKVQFLVRGHWRNQAHGAGRALRRRQWIQPFWKGPEEARVLLRSHVLEEPER